MPRDTTNPSCSITVNLFSGKREPLKLKSKSKVLLTVIDGNQNQVHRKHHAASSITLKGLPFFNNFGDNYTVIASASGYKQSGFTPVKVAPQSPATVDLMLLPEDPDFDFHEARWDAIRQGRSYSELLAQGAASAQAAGDRYSDVLENRPDALACMLNIFTAIQEIHLPSGTPVDYLRGVIWDEEMKGDRFYTWADPELVAQVGRSAADGLFEPQPGAALFHPGATRSYKQVQYGEANVQITFHENDKQTIDGVRCVKVELDIDYYKDKAAHALLEVLFHRVTGAATDPRQVYVLRWIAGRHAGVPDFEPPYYLV
jgi:hypothetical protein